MKKTNVDVAYGMDFFEKTLFLMMGFHKSKKLQEFKKEQAYVCFIEMVEEICRAFQKMSLAGPEEIDDIKQFAFEPTKIKDTFQNAVPDSEYFKTLSDFMMLCKAAGIFPYYTAYVAGVSLYNVLPEQNHPVVAGVIKEGLQKTIENVMLLHSEAEMVYLIGRAFQNVYAGIWEDKSKIELMRIAFEEGFLDESLYGGCSQCVVKAMLTVMKRNDEKADFLFKTASSLSGGVAGCNDGACGAYIGANMIISSLLGRELTELEDDESKSYQTSNCIGQILHDEFVKVYGTVLCCKVHECIFGRQFNFRNETDFEAFKNAGAHEEKCPCVVGLTAALLTEALYEEGII